MPTTQDIEAGLAPAGIGPPAAPPPPPDPLRLGALPAQQPSLQVVDRQEYLRQQQAAAEARRMAQALQEQKNAEFQRYVEALRSREFQQGTQQLIQAGIGAAQQGLGNQLDQRRQQQAFPAAQHVNAPGVVTGSRESPLINALTTHIPYSEDVANVVGKLGERAGQNALQTALPGIPGVNRIPGVSKINDVAGSVGYELASSLVPQNVWQAALTLLPAAKARSIPELISAVTLGDSDAINAIRNAGKRLGESPRVESLLGQVASESGFLKFGQKPVHQMNLAEVEAALVHEKNIEANASKIVFGDEGAKVYDAAQRTANSTSAFIDPAKQREADAVIRRMEANLTPQQEKILFGIGEKGPNAEELAFIANKMNSLDYQSPQALGRSLRWAITKVDPAKNPAEMNVDELAAFMEIKHAFTQARAAGWDTNEVSAAALAGAMSRFPDPQDAELMLKPFLQKMARPSTAESAQRLLGSERGSLTLGPGDELKASIMEKIRGNKPVRMAQEQVRHEERISRSGAVEKALSSNLSPDETIAAINAARKGAYHAAEFDPAGFDNDQLAWMFKQIADSPKLTGKGFTKGDAVDAINRLQNGKGIRAFEERILGDVFGPEFVAALKERGTNDLLSNIARAWATPGIDPLRPQEIVPVGERYFTPSVQQGADLGVNAAMDAAQKGGRGAFGIAESPSLESNLANAVKTPDSLGPTEQTRVIQAFSDATAKAADEAATNAVNAAHLEHQLQNGAQPEWYYHDQAVKAEQDMAKALENGDPLKTTGEIWRDRALKPFQLWRTVKTSFDNSFGGRQGWKLLASNTREWLGAYGRSWQAMWSPQLADQVDAEVKAFSTYELGQRLKEPLAVLSETRRPEEFLTSTKKIPVLNRFERAYEAFANYLRQASFHRDVMTWEKHYGPITDEAAQRFAQNINTATLYGNLSKMGDSTSLLGQTFFSLRAKAALPQFLMDTARVMRPGVDPVTRRIIATRMAGWLTLNMSLLYAAKWAGAKTGVTDKVGAITADLDPWSKTFGKIVNGPQSYDLWTGYAPLVRAIINVGDRESTGKYVHNQLSPAAGVAYDFTFGNRRDYKGRDLMDKKQLAYYGLDQVDPLFFSDVWDAWKANGIIGGGIAGPLAFHGIGTQTYSPSETQQAKDAKDAAAGPLSTVGYQDIVPDTWHDNLDALSTAIPADEIAKPLAQYDNIEDVKKDYLEPGPNEHPTRAQVEARGRQFEAIPAVKAYKQQIKDREVYILRKADPKDVQAAYDAGVIKLDSDQRKALGVK